MRTKGAERSTDVQHRIYDELHDASNWELFLLSYDLYQLKEGADIYIYFMTATTDTPIFEAIMKAVTCTLPDNEIKLVTMPGTHAAANNASEIPDSFLDPNFDNLSFAEQVSNCIFAIIEWAVQPKKSAAILVLVPGENEMQKVILDFTKSVELHLCVYC